MSGITSGANGRGARFGGATVYIADRGIGDARFGRAERDIGEMELYQSVVPGAASLARRKR